MSVKKPKSGAGRVAGVDLKAATSQTKGSVAGADLRQRVVVRYTDGRVLRGFTVGRKETALQDTLPESLEVKDPNGNSVKVGDSDIKAIFFVKSFEGSPDYTEFKIFSSRPTGKGVWVRVHFKDGEVIEGVAPNCFETYSRPVFCMTPPNPGSNNQRVLVAKHYLKEMQVLRLASE